LKEVEKLILPAACPKPKDVAASLHSAESFSALYTHRHLVVYRYIYGLLGGPTEEVEDLAAETFERAWRTRHSFRGDEGAELGWLLKIARRLVIDTYRRRCVRGVDEDIETANFLTSDEGPEPKTVEREQRETLWRLLQELPPDHCELIVLRYLLGWRVNQIAQYVQLTENNVSVTLRRLLARLRDNWPQA
jgi:RNA polymerase sigma-70 factor, ECF subfamily